MALASQYLVALIAAMVILLPTHVAEAFSPIHPVLAWYYGWYNFPSDWHPTAYQPLEFYNSYDAATMRRQIEQARSAGIDGFICTWQYNCVKLLNIAADYGDFGVAISVDPVATTMGSMQEVIRSIEQVKGLMPHPAYLRWADGRPVLVFWNSGILPGDSSVDAFRQLRDIVDPDRHQFWLGGGDNFQYLEVFDAIQYFDISWERYPGAGMASYARRLATYNSQYGRQRPFVATVMPGYDDLALRGPGGHRRDREDGNYYDATWDAALTYSPEAIVITSWNEWKEGSQIEPGVTYRTLYLDITRQRVNQYRTSASGAGDPAFARTWQRNDLPVREGKATRSWLWGLARGSAMVEPYVDAPGGKRLVQYFDKSRMEINDPAADNSSPWFVTNGLLVWEMTTGRVQQGATVFETREPADTPVAGDIDDNMGPTYATFQHLLSPTSQRIGPVSDTIERSGRTGQNWDLASLASYAYYVPETGHNIPDVFWSFLNSVGPLSIGDNTVEGKLFDPTFYATGLPITEPYWTRAKVGGQPRWVLVQLFERRALTFTPDNPPGWQVEMGNVGLHYYIWRYGRGR